MWRARLIRNAFRVMTQIRSGRRQVEIPANKMAGYVYGEATGGWMTSDEAGKPNSLFFGENNPLKVIAIFDKRFLNC